MKKWKYSRKTIINHMKIMLSSLEDYSKNNIEKSKKTNDKYEIRSLSSDIASQVITDYLNLIEMKKDNSI